MIKAANTEDIGTIQVYMFSAGQMDMKICQSIIMYLHAWYRVIRIFVDEAHLTVMWEDSRPNI